VINFEIKGLMTAEQTEDSEQGFPLILGTATMNSPFAPETKLTSEDPAKKWLVRWRKLGNACEGSAASSRQFRAKCGVIIT
jgi:hypothetical protein